MQSETPFANDDWRCKKMSEIENDAAEDVSYEDNEKHVVRRRANGRATRLKILAAARAIIIEKGTDSLSIDRVIKEAGVSKGSFMYHFPSRQALIEALVNEETQMNLCQVAAVMRAARANATGKTESH